MRRKSSTHLLGITLSGVFLVAALMLAGCSKTSTPPLSTADSLRIVEETVSHRAEVDSFFRHDSQSPFHRDTAITYNGIRWFPVNVNFYFRSRLYRYPQPKLVKVMGTQGEEREFVRYGYFILEMDGKQHRLNVYKFAPSDAQRYALYKDHLSVWFTDLTTGDETYEVGRYIDVGTENANEKHVYTINFNNAYNPYCAYSALYSCAIPLREDHLEFAVRAGEMKYHLEDHH